MLSTVHSNTTSPAASSLSLRPGDWVEVKSWGEIKNTLDSNGMLDKLPFMPEMLPYCGRRLQVDKRADRTCEAEIRKMNNAVHLEDLRCNGSAHGGCEANCTFIWKEAWLTPVPSESGDHALTLPATGSAATTADVPPELKVLQTSSARPRYICQATELRAATAPLKWWNLRQLWLDIRTGNVRLEELKFFLQWCWHYIFWFTFKQKGKLAKTKIKRTPTQILDLQVGDRVRVKSRGDIFKTLDHKGKNRGLAFSTEMLKYCGREFTVKARVDKMIAPETGEMMDLKNPCILLESVICVGQCVFCPRRLYHYWREIWLERVENAVEQIPDRPPLAPPLYTPPKPTPPPGTRVA